MALLLTRDHLELHSLKAAGSQNKDNRKFDQELEKVFCKKTQKKIIAKNLSI